MIDRKQAVEASKTEPAENGKTVPRTLERLLVF